MKKFFTIFVAIILVFSLAACNKNASNNEATSNDTTVNNENTETTTMPTDNEATVTTEPTGETTNSTTPSEGSNETNPTKPTEQETVPEPTHTHEYTSVVTNPTCTKDGYTTHTCKGCANSYVDTVVKATGHNFGEWKTTKEPTTTSTGTAERICSKCSYKETKTLGKLEESHKHNYTSKITKAATCASEGVKTYSCSCGDSYSEAIPETAHTYKDTVVKPTCTNGGYTTHTCTVCGYSISDTQTPKNGHSWTPATCTAPKTCSVCGITEDEALGHNYKKEVVNPTCDNGGYTKYTCTRNGCSYSYTDSQTAKTGHNYQLTSDTATCTSPGTKTETCSNCGNKKTSASSAKGHGETKVETKEATCSKAGYKKTVCKTCGQTISNETIPANGQCSYKTMDLCSAATLAAENGKMNYAKYASSSYSDYNTKICTGCYNIDLDSTNFKYTQREAAQIMLNYVNDLRAEVFGTHAYDLTIDSYAQSLAEKRAVQLVTNYSHSGSNSAGECIVSKLSLYEQFVALKNSSTHYAVMTRKDYQYFGYGYAANEGDGYVSTQGFGCMTFFT